MGWLKEKFRNWLEIRDPLPQVIDILAINNEDVEIFLNKIWYRGVAGELEQVYADKLYDMVGNSHFWGSRPTLSMKQIRKIHTGLPALIVDTLADICVDDLDSITVTKRQDEWDEIALENNFKELLKTATIKALWGGDGAFKLSYDANISKYPIIEFYGADRVYYEYDRGRLIAIIFKTKKRFKNRDFVLHERYDKKGITYTLVDKDGNEQNIADFEEYQPITNTAGFMCAVPLMFYKSEKYYGRGKSIFDGKIDNFDAFDEVWSQWMLAVRKGQIKTYIPDVLLPRDPKTGIVLNSNDFDNDYISTGSDMTEGAANKIETTQGQIQHDALLATYVTSLDLCLQGLISPSTLGIDTKKLDNAEAQREKEKTTLYKRQQIIQVLEKVIKELVDTTFKMYDTLNKTPLTETECTVSFGGYANPSFEAQIETMGKASTTGVLSTESIVEEIWGDTKDEDWKAEEVRRIKQEKGIEIMDEPAINEDIKLIEDGAVLDKIEGKEQNALNKENASNTK